jgi:hypothetical protein
VPGSRQQPIFDASVDQPQRYTCVRLIFEDGRSAGGVWTGKEWWCEGRRVLPKQWQLFALKDPAADCAETALAPKWKDGNGALPGPVGSRTGSSK